MMRFLPLLLLLCPLFAQAQSVCPTNTVVGNASGSTAAPSCQSSLTVTSITTGAPGNVAINASAGIAASIEQGSYYLTGVDATGVTDVEAAFATQLSTATAAGSCLLLPPGIYGLASPVPAVNGNNCIRGAGPGPSIIKALVSNTGPTALLFTINAVVNSINVTDFLLDNVVLDGGMPNQGGPPTVANPRGVSGGGTDANVATFTGSISGTALTVASGLTGTVYNGHTIFDSGGSLSGLGVPSNITVASGGPCTVAPCTLTLSASAGSVGSETMYSTNHIPLISAVGSLGYTSQARVAQFGCRIRLKNSTVQNVSRTFGNIAGCNNSELSNNLFNNVGAGGNNYEQTANLPFISWNAAATQFSPTATVNSGTSAITLNVNSATCGIYFAYTDLQALNPQFYPTIAQTSPNTFIANNTVVQSIAFNGGASCTRSAGNPATVTVVTGGTGGMTLTLSQAVIGTINIGDFVKVYDFQATGNRTVDNVFRNFGSTTNIIDGQQGFICARNFWFGNYGLGNVTSSGGGNSSCFEQGSQLPGNTHTIIADNYVYQITGNGFDLDGGTATEVTGNTVIDSGRAGISLTSNGIATSENPLVMMDGVAIAGNTVKNSNFSTNIAYQTGTATITGPVSVTTGGGAVTTLTLRAPITGTCAAGSYVTLTAFVGYPYPAGAVNQAGIFSSGWAAGTMTMSTGLYAVSSTIPDGTIAYCNNRMPVPSGAGFLDANLTVGMQPSGSIGTVQNASIDGNVFSDDQYVPLPTATLTTNASTASGNVLPFASTTGAAVGQSIYCAGTQPFSTVTAVVTNVSVTLSAPIANTVGNAATCWFYNPIPTILYNVDAANNVTFRNVNIGPSNQMLGAPSTNFSPAAAQLLIPKNNQGYSMPYVLAQSAIPIGIPASSASGIGNNGAITLSVALDKTYGPTNNNIPGIYLYFPAGTLSTAGSTPGNAAGLYWCIMTSTAAGTCYANTYTSGTPQPFTSATATPLVSTGSTTFTQAGTAISLLTAAVPGNALGLNGSLDIDALAITTTTNTKTITAKYGSNQVLSAAYTTATVNPEIHSTVTNAGIGTSQTTRSYISSLTAAGALAATATTLTNTDSTAAQNAIVSVTLSAPGTDYVVFQNYSFKVSPN